MKTKRSKYYYVACICLALMLASTLFLATQGATQPIEEKLKIGCLLCLTGWFSVFDLNEYRDVKIVTQMINDKGGIAIAGKKYKIEVITEDVKSTLDGCTTAATRLVYDKNVKFVVGPSGYFCTASSPVFEQNKILHVAGFCTNQPGELDKSTPYGFLGHNSTVGDTIAGIRGMKKEFPKLKNIAITTPDDGAVPYVVPIVNRLLASEGYTVVGKPVTYANELIDFNPIASKLNAIKEADGILHVNGGPQHGAGILKGLREMGNQKPYTFTAVIPAEDILTIAGKEASTNFISIGLGARAPGNPPLFEEVFDRIGKKPEIIALCVPNALWILAQVIQAANSFDPAIVKAKWESMDTVSTLYGPGVISGNETYGIKHHAVGHPISYQKLMDGKALHGGWVNVGAIP